jgi:hypothetical protein
MVATLVHQTLKNDRCSEENGARVMKSWFYPFKGFQSFRAKKPTVFQGFWHGPPLGLLRQACLCSFIRQGHIFELYTYAPFSVPDGVVLKNAEDIIPFTQLFYFENPETGRKDLAPFSDLFRFKLLFERGGWWSDVDTVCFSANIPAVEQAWAQEWPEFNTAAIGNSQMAMRKGDPLATMLYARCLALSRTKFARRESLGTHLLSSVIHEMALPTNVFGQPDLFYPIRWIEMFKLWMPRFRDEVYARCRRSLFVPIYQSFPEYIGLTLEKLPPRGSFLADVCATYIPCTEGVEHYLEEEIVEGTKDYFRRNADWAFSELKAVGGEGTIIKLGLRQID